MSQGLTKEFLDDVAKRAGAASWAPDVRSGIVLFRFPDGIITAMTQRSLETGAIPLAPAPPKIALTGDYLDDVAKRIGASRWDTSTSSYVVSFHFPDDTIAMISKASLEAGEIPSPPEWKPRPGDVVTTTDGVKLVVDGVNADGEKRNVVDFGSFPAVDSGPFKSWRVERGDGAPSRIVDVERLDPQDAAFLGADRGSLRERLAKGGLQQTRAQAKALANELEEERSKRRQLEERLRFVEQARLAIAEKAENEARQRAELAEKQKKAGVEGIPMVGSDWICPGCGFANPRDRIDQCRGCGLIFPDTRDFPRADGESPLEAESKAVAMGAIRRLVALDARVQGYGKERKWSFILGPRDSPRRFGETLLIAWQDVDNKKFYQLAGDVNRFDRLSDGTVRVVVSAKTALALAPDPEFVARMLSLIRDEIRAGDAASKLDFSRAAFETKPGGINFTIPAGATVERIEVDGVRVRLADATEMKIELSARQIARAFEGMDIETGTGSLSPEPPREPEPSLLDVRKRLIRPEED